ncbi:leucine-rich repeat and calponin homology domain-containing protein 1 isoform X3 [Solea solea]|uniref:leucine-rich repeat and calponin homology domain-containing protein 1 isoform X3 n=1 Tax=Solea solea TaxID=90069 RepID=UPI00272C6EB1|nr:leucine-rich repeat and calponin homology domain-containing protein 1 isoform X3 [Solea solea]
MATLLGAESGRSPPPPPPLPPLPLLSQHGSGSPSSPSNHTHNLPPNRGLERALEEAAASGVLHISCRKLKEFPRSAVNHDLSDTVEADLSKNRLSDVPSEVCHLVALETLNLYHNCIRTIPDSVISLQSLTSLNLSRNQLCSLPACLCGLPLRVLNASNNKLVCLPENITQLHGLMELDVSCNEITALPRYVGRLKALRELNVRRNLLCVLPEVCFRTMKQLQSLHLENNPLQSPPAQICLKGKVHIFKYLSIEACRCEKMPDSLYLPVIERLSLSRPSTGSVEDMEQQQKKQDSDSGVGSDNGDKRLSATEPSDEDSLSLNVPMSHITEEEGLSKDDSTEHISSLTVDTNYDSVRLIEESPTEALKDQFSCRDSALSSHFINYIKGRAAADLDEPLRIEEDSSWQTEQTSKVTVGTELHIDMINQLKEAVELLQEPSRVPSQQDHVTGVRLYPVEMVTVDESLNGQDSEDSATTAQQLMKDEEETGGAAAGGGGGAGGGCEFQRKRQMILDKARFQAQLAYREYEWHMSIKRGDVPPAVRLSSFSPFGLKPRSAPPSLPCSPPPSCFESSPLLQATPLRRDTRCSHDDGGVHGRVFLRSHKSLESVDPQFTIRRKMEQLREELELMETLRDSIESRLKVVLPDDLGSSLMDGVVLCHLANHIRPRSVGSIHVPSPAVPKLSMAKCRRNVESFLDACRRIGVPESSLCSPYDITQCRLQPLRRTLQALVALDTNCPHRKREESISTPSPAPSAVSKTPSLVSVTTQTPPPAWQIWDVIGSSLLHVLCLVLLFLAYTWSELT